jgi:hypothetical protein
MNRLKHGIIVLTALLLTTAGWAEQDNAGQPLRLELDLVDGSSIIGVPTIKSVAVETTYAKMDIPLKQIVNIKIEDDHETASFELQNGDKLKGVLNLEPIELETVFGEVSLGVQHVTSIHVRSEGLINEGLVLYYSFDKDEGNKVTDQSGKKNDGNVVGAKWTKKGRIGGAYEFDNSVQLIRAPGPWDLGEQYTIDTCVKFRHFNGYYPMIIWGTDRQIVCHGRGRMGYGAGKEGGVAFYSLQEDDAKEHFRHSMTTSKCDVGKWYSITVVVNRRKASLYINGELDAQEEDSTAYGIADMQSISIGGCDEGPRSPSFRQFHGAIDEVRIWKRALSEMEVKQLHNSRKEEA